ncbi:MAG: hypothetical protein COT84_02940 [Chlamydiae bacterium CG10_big_fil_rev_8_21_14_0_10_35_9]|nr:MAG: hypothetical protein COT84_02940 [Chlamydiae bacterium CG10_big_fil_rev_8_21_14_0_10_35_9]
MTAIQRVFIYLLALTATLFCYGGEGTSIFHYKDHEALVFDLPKNRIILLEKDAELYQYALKKLENQEESKLRRFVQMLNTMASCINSGDLLQREKAFSFLISHLDAEGEEYEEEIAFKLVEDRNHIELSPLFSTVKERDRKELIVAGIHTLGQLQMMGTLEEVSCAFREFNQAHSIFNKGDWFDYALACYFSGKLTDGELCSLALLSTLISYRQPEDIVSVEVVDLESKIGEKFFSEFYQGILKSDATSVYQRLLFEIKDKSLLEKLVFRISFSKKPNMQDFNSFVLRGMCYHQDECLLHLMPFTFHRLLKMHFGDNVQDLSACFGFSEKIKDWCHDQRPISIPCTRIPVMSCVHNQKISHLIETLVHDTAHQMICSHIPKMHRDKFRKVANYLDKESENLLHKQELLAIRNYFYDMPFLYYTRENIPSELTFYIPFVVAIYRTLSTKWQNSFIDEIIGLALYLQEHDPNYMEQNFLTQCETYLENPLLSNEMRCQLQGDKDLVIFLKDTLCEALQETVKGLDVFQAN